MTATLPPVKMIPMDDDRSDEGDSTTTRGIAAIRHEQLVRLGYFGLGLMAINTFILVAVFSIALSVRHNVDAAVESACGLVRPADVGAAAAAPSDKIVKFTTALLRESIAPVLFGNARDDAMATVWEEFMTYDLKKMSTTMATFAKDVDGTFRQRKCPDADIEAGTDAMECEAFNQIAQAASAVGSVSGQVAKSWVNVNVPKATRKAFGAEEKTRGLLSFDLVRAADWLVAQMQQKQWVSLGGVCEQFAAGLEAVDWEGRFRSAAGRSVKWDVNGEIKGMSEMLHHMCGRLSALHPEHDTTRK